MSTANKNVLAIILWVIGLLGVTGYINRFGFFALVIPILFLIMGSAYTRSHAKEYFNVLVGSVVIYFVGILLNTILGWFDVRGFNWTLIALIYFTIMSILGLIRALSSERFRAPMSVRIFK
jgi:hypothetical protein